MRLTHWLCPACPAVTGTRKALIEHAALKHGMTRSEATGGWHRPADWDPCDSANKDRRIR